MKVLQVGAGGFGRVWLDALAAEPEAELVALVDQDPAALVPGLPGYVELDEALATSGAELAVVVVPPAAHREVAERCLAAGLPVLVEKPLAGTREDCEALIDAAERAGRQLAVSQNYRYRPVIETARRILAGGELGEIGQAQVDFRIHHDFRGSFRERMEQPLILDMAVHSFDLIRFVTGLEAADVWARTWNPPWSQFDGDASAMVLFTMDSGARVAYNGSWHPRGQFTDWNCRWLVECERGYLTLDRDVVRVYRGDDVHRPGTAADEEIVPLVALGRTDQTAVLMEFAAAVRDGRPAPTNAVDNLRTVGMVLAAVEAATLVRTASPTPID
jgi:predicted dehydrogenase